MRYQWGRKDPFTFATRSEMWGVASHENGKFPIKIYTIDGVLIYQNDNGSNNKDKQPVGGVISLLTKATSMMEVINNPIMYFSNQVISQTEYTKDLWDYYWTSYSRGTDGVSGNLRRHNEYLNKYTSQISKSIYDPCPFGFRVPSNGTYNQFTSNQGWVEYNYVGGVQSIISATSTWMPSIGMRTEGYGLNAYAGQWSSYRMSTIGANTTGYAFEKYCRTEIRYNRHDMPHSRGTSVRCIDFFVSPLRPTGEMLVATLLRQIRSL